MKVTDVEGDSLALAVGLEKGDLLLGVGEWQTTSVRELRFIAHKL